MHHIARSLPLSIISRSTSVSLGSQLAHLLYILGHWLLFVVPILIHGSSYGVRRHLTLCSLLLDFLQDATELMEPLAHVFPPIWVSLLHFIKRWCIAQGITMHSNLVQLLNALKCFQLWEWPLLLGLCSIKLPSQSLSNTL